MDYLTEVEEILKIVESSDLEEYLLEQEGQINELFDRARKLLKKAWKFVKQKISGVFMDKVKVAAERVEKRIGNLNEFINGFAEMRKSGEISRKALSDPSFRDDMASIIQNLQTEIDGLRNDTEELDSAVNSAIQDMYAKEIQ